RTWPHRGLPLANSVSKDFSPASSRATVRTNRCGARSAYSPIRRSTQWNASKSSRRLASIRVTASARERARSSLRVKRWSLSAIASLPRATLTSSASLPSRAACRSRSTSICRSTSEMVEPPRACGTRRRVSSAWWRSKKSGLCCRYAATASSSFSLVSNPRASRVVMSSNLYVACEGYLRGPRQPDMLSRTIPVYAQLAAAHADVHFTVELAPSASHRHRGTGARAAGQGLACPALVHAQTDVPRTDDLHEAGIHPPGEARMTLDRRTQPLHRSRVHRLHGDSGARGTDGDGADLDAAACHLEGVTFLFGRRIEGERARIEPHRSHVHGHEPTCHRPRPDEAGGTVHRDGARGCEPAAREERADAAGTIAALLHLHAIGVEDAVVHGGVGSPGRLQDERLVEPDAGVAVREAADERAVERGAGGGIEHGEVVAEPVHLGELEAHYRREG